VNFWDVFDAAAARYGDRVAIEVQRRESLERHTYRDLREMALSHAAWLSEQGVGAGDRCAIFADNDASWCAAYLGVLRIGAVAVPLDTNYSVAQIRTIVEDAGARVLFVNERLEPTAREAVSMLSDVVIADLARPRTAADGPIAPVHRTAPSAPREPDAPIAPDYPAVILYTSGTTADPKGVVLTHGNLIAERDAAFRVIDVTEHDSVLGVLPLFHALAQLANLLLPFAAGARVVFLETLSSSELVRALTEREITIFACVPQFFYLIHERLLQEVRKGGLLSRVVFRRLLALSFALRRAGVNVGPVLFRRVHTLLGRHLRLFITGGSKFDPKIGRDFYALGFTILQAYGLTETTGAATLTQQDEAHLDTVGRPLPGQEIKILPSVEEDLDGEIAIRGPIVMQGYFNRPDATRSVMAGDWFLSGDLGKFDQQGRLTITGRRKEVIVLANGKNIYPEEVEAQYRQSAFIKEICVLGVTSPNEPNAERLFAVVVPDADLLRERRIVNAGDLLRFEIEGQSIHLPPYKRVLGYEVWFEPLPRTTTGKLKRHEIARRLQGRRDRPVTVDDAAPDTTQRWSDDPHAAAVAEIVRGRARGRPLTREANLELDLGLDSMERVELLTDLEQRFGVRVPEDRAHEILTVGQLIDAVRPGTDSPAAGSIEGSWSILLRNLPAPTDPALRALLGDRPVAAPLFFAISRIVRVFLGPSIITGRRNLPQQGAYIISPNHQSYVDPFIICAALPYRLFRNLFFVGASEYFATPFMRWLARKINLLPVDPDANLVSAMQASALGLRHGKILMLFPEGERSIDGTVKRFKKGAPILAQVLGVPIVPVAIKGAHELWPRNRAINWRLLMPWSRHHVRVAIGAPMQFDTSAEYGDSATRLRTAVEELWQRL
jgi:long-chain acyl-CoA synthetase